MIEYAAAVPWFAGEQSLRGLLHRAAAEHPEADAVVDGLGRYRYAELLTAVQRMAALLHSLGVRKGDRVALLMPASASHVIALFGAIELGAIPCALHARETAATLAAVTTRLAPRVLVYDAAYAEQAGQLREAVPSISATVRARSELSANSEVRIAGEPLIPDELPSYEPAVEPMPLAVDEPAVIALSSGTTSLPKGIVHTHQTLLASAATGARYLDTGEDNCAINPFTTAFIGWYNMYLPFLWLASKVVFLGRWDAQAFLQRVETERVTVSFLVPTLWRMLLKEDLVGHDLSSLRLAGYAGEPMDSATAQAIRERICPAMLNTYGTTETGSWGGCTVMLPEDFARGAPLDSVGRAAEQVEIRVIEPGGDVDRPLPPGAEGEVTISGPSVASQVWEQPELARRIFTGRWWRSGDLGVLDEQGYLYLRGRIDDMIISGGINVMPGEIEELILTHPAVSECVVIGLPDPEWGQRITALVVARDGLTAEALGAHVEAAGLASYKRPREYRFVAELPRGNTGKLSRRLAREMAG